MGGKRWPEREWRAARPRLLLLEARESRQPGGARRVGSEAAPRNLPKYTSAAVPSSLLLLQAVALACDCSFLEIFAALDCPAPL